MIQKLRDFGETERKNMKKFGFTLAEVLITLGIIGVVAAMTLPTLFGNIQKRQTVSRLQKVYAELKQAVKISSDENGDPSGWDYTLTNEEFIKRYFAPYLKISVVNVDHTYTDLQGRSRGYYHSDNPTFITMSGAFVMFYHEPQPYQAQNHLLVDINGKTPPNRMGKDVFAFTFLDENLVTYTQYTSQGMIRELSIRKNLLGSGTSGQCSYTAGGGIFGAGSYCSRLIEVDGWKIADDYPW